MNRQEFINKFMPNGNGEEGLKIKLVDWDEESYYIIPIAVGKETFIYINHNGYEYTRDIDALWQLYEPPIEELQEEKKYCNWKRIDDGYGFRYEYKTDCDNVYDFLEDFKYCPYCSLEIREVEEDTETWEKHDDPEEDMKEETKEDQVYSWVNYATKEELKEITKSIYNINMRLGDIEKNRCKMSKTEVFEINNRIGSLAQRVARLEVVSGVEI